MPLSPSFKIFFEDGIGAYYGPVIKTKLHTHHAYELILGLEGSFKIAGVEGMERQCRLAIIPHDLPHRFVGNANTAPVFIFLDPFHHWSHRLFNHLVKGRKIILMDEWFDIDIIREWQEWVNTNGTKMKPLIASLVDHLTGSVTAHSHIDERILKSITHIKDSLHTNLRINQVASEVHLSEGRFAHLFKEQVGIPFRRYVLWTRLQSTVKSIIGGDSLTVACYKGGFSDLPHFSKTFVDMFGVSPSSVLKG